MSTESGARILNILGSAAEGMYYGLVVGTLIITISFFTGGIGLAVALSISVGVAAVGSVLGGIKGYLDHKESTDADQQNEALLTRIADSLDIIRESTVRENRSLELSDSHSLIIDQLALRADSCSDSDRSVQSIILYQNPEQKADEPVSSNEPDFPSQEDRDPIYITMRF